MSHHLAGADDAAVRHLLESPTIAARTAPYVGEGEFDWEGLLVEQQTMSGGERVLVLIAHDLWNANATIRVADLVRRLDRRHFERVIEAFEISRGELPVRPAASLREAA
jgi:hypothetical protein